MNLNDPDLADDGIVSLYIGSFAARDDLYVENGAEVRRAPLTPDVVRKAIRHKYPVSAYLGDTTGRTHVGAIDFDNDDGLTMAQQTQSLLMEHNLPSLLVESRRGAHLWVTCWNWSDCGTMHRALTGAVGLAAGPEAMEDPKVEVFPKRGEDLAVGALRLPGLAHHKTQQVYAVAGIADPTLRQIIEVHELGDADAVKRLAGTAPRPKRYPKGLDNFYGYRPERALGDAPKATEVLASWGVQVRPGGTVQCPMHEDRRRSMTVFKDDARVFCGAPHCRLNNSGHGVGSIELSKMKP